MVVVIGVWVCVEIKKDPRKKLSISHWYVQDCNRINIDLTMFLTIDRNTDIGYKIKNSSYGQLVIVLVF